MISYLCKVAGVSRSGYYKYFSSESKDLRKSREDKDILSKENVLKAFNFKGRKTFMESLNTKYLYEKEKLDDKTINKIRKA